MNDFQKSQSAKILACYGVDANELQKSAEEAALKKSEESGVEEGKEEGKEKEEEDTAEEAK